VTQDRQFTEPRLVIATHNAGKLREFRTMFGAHPVALVSAGELGLPEPEETGDSFSANAMLKARMAAKASNEVALADDSGLSVTALGGAPGIYSARWAGADKNFMAAMERIHTELGDSVDRSACFICVLALAWPDGYCAVATGRIDGDLVWPPRGTNGFGYDPMFVPIRQQQTVAEMDPQRKHQFSHRARAFRQMITRHFSARG
jgi:XTP/dITP diphosphohydrolase